LGYDRSSVNSPATSQTTAEDTPLSLEYESKGQGSEQQNEYSDACKSVEMKFAQASDTQTGDHQKERDDYAEQAERLANQKVSECSAIASAQILESNHCQTIGISFESSVVGQRATIDFPIEQIEQNGKE
jgi:hypothetical protein